MRKKLRYLIMTMMLCLVSTKGYAQLEGMFYCQEFMNDVEDFKGTIKGNIKTRCEKLMKLGHMNDDGEIQYQYVIHLKDSLNIPQFMETIKKWGAVTYSKSTALVSETDSMVEYNATYLNVGQYAGPFKMTLINASASSKIEAKADRIRITSRVMHYSLASGSMAGAKNELTLPKETYPFIESKDKNTYGMAYINSNLRLIANVGSIIDYLNKNYIKQPEKKKEDSNW